MSQQYSRFFGIVQAGYRKLLNRITQLSEPTSIDVQGSDSDGTIERPCTPTTFSRVSSFKKSFSSADRGDDGGNGSPFLNQFTTVGKAYGMSLAHSTSPSKTRVPRPLSMPPPTLDFERAKTEDHRMGIHPPIQAPSSPTTTRPEKRTQVPVASSGSKDDGPQGIAGGVEDTGIGDTGTATLLPSVDLSPSRGLRSSKRHREDRGGESKTGEQSRSGGMPGKRKKV
jgi:hypothetical protein